MRAIRPILVVALCAWPTASLVSLVHVGSRNAYATRPASRNLPIAPRPTAPIPVVQMTTTAVASNPWGGRAIRLLGRAVILAALIILCTQKLFPAISFPVFALPAVGHTSFVGLFSKMAGSVKGVVPKLIEAQCAASAAHLQLDSLAAASTSISPRLTPAVMAATGLLTTIAGLLTTNTAMHLVKSSSEYGGSQIDTVDATGAESALETVEDMAAMPAAEEVAPVGEVAAVAAVEMVDVPAVSARAMPAIKMIVSGFPQGVSPSRLFVEFPQALAIDALIHKKSGARTSLVLKFDSRDPPTSRTGMSLDCKLHTVVRAPEANTEYALLRWSRKSAAQNVEQGVPVKTLPAKEAAWGQP